MKAKIHLDGTMLEEIEVQNSLRQGCSMAPVLFNLYKCLAVERWLVRIEDTEKWALRSSTNRTRNCSGGILRTLVRRR